MSASAPRTKQQSSSEISDGIDSRLVHSRNDTKPASIVKRALFLVLAGIFFLLALIGILLPGLPTTPFLLVTSYFLLQSWPAAHDRLLRSRLFGGILRDWQEHRAVRRRVKVKSIVAMALLMAFSIYWYQYSLAVAVGTVGIALLGIALILKLPEIKES